jgi:hypothetical protein
VKLRIKKLSSQAMGQARGPCGLNNCTWILRANTKSCPLLIVSVQPSASDETGLGTRGCGRTVGSKQNAVRNKTGEMVAEHGKVLLPSPQHLTPGTSHPVPPTTCHLLPTSQERKPATLRFLLA